MSIVVSYHPDQDQYGTNPAQSFSQRWVDIASHFDVVMKETNVYSPRLYRDLRDSDAFMWRMGSIPHYLRFAKILVPAIEKGLNLPTYPNLNTLLHCNDKIAQKYLMDLHQIPHPQTEVLWTREEAIAYCERVQYPFVMKLSSGWQSLNVRLIESREEAHRYVERMFLTGITLVQDLPVSKPAKFVDRLRESAELLVTGRRRNLPNVNHPLEYGYLFAQEFLPGNTFDTRILVIGKIAWGFRRHNRAGDFRASGSGENDWDARKVDERFVKLAFSVAEKMNLQTVMIDGLYSGEDPVVGELGFGFAVWAINHCKGYWKLDGNSENGQVTYHEEESMRPEDVIFESFLETISG